MKNGWSGGQYSLFRVTLGVYLFVHFVELLPYREELFSMTGILPFAALSPLGSIFPNVLRIADTSLTVGLLLLCGCWAAIQLAAGLSDRIAAVALWYIWACLFGRNPLIANPSYPLVGWILLFHACLPPAPYGSWRSRGRDDPAGDWQVPPVLFRVLWIVLAVSYSYSGLTKLPSPSWIDGSALSRILENPLARPTFLRDALLALPAGILRLATWGALGLELCFAPLALFRRLRPYLWGAAVLMHIGLLLLLDFADLAIGMLLAHFIAFDPAWIAKRKADGMDELFYDGACGVCHRAVRFLLSEDGEGKLFLFAPLGGERFSRAIPEDARRALPDSLVVRTASGEVLMRAAAVQRILERCGGLWRVIGGLSKLVPIRWLDAGYDRFAKIRHRFVEKPKETCPVLAPKYGRRFLG